VGWYREHERQEDMVSFNLGCGALLVAVPLAIAVLLHRSERVPEFSTLNELGMLAAGVLLLASGFMFQIRSTTLAGAGLLAIYLVTLVLYVNKIEGVQTAAIWMSIGGGVIFGTGILLSVYRDRLLTLPDQVKRREGVFRVLRWR
jgi:NADH:ubiquinone oxidoreductase subunit K